MNRVCSVALEGNSGTLKIEHTSASITLLVDKSRRFINFCPLCGDKSANWYAYETNIFVDKPNLVETKK